MKRSGFFKKYSNQDTGNFHAAKRHFDQGWNAEKLAEDCSDNKQKINHYNDAINFYTQAIKLNPEYRAAFKNRGYAREKLVRLLPDADNGQKLVHYEKAVEDYTKTIHFDPTDHQAFGNRGYAKGEQGRISLEARYYEEAIVDFNKVISLLINKTSNNLIGKLARAYQNRAWNKGQLGELKEETSYYHNAIDDCDRAISLSVNNAGDARAYHIRAWNKEKIGIDANDDYNRAAELNPEKYGSLTNRLSC